MELRLITPQEQWITQGIHWNNEELKTAIAEKLKDYVGLQYTEDTIKEAKKDKASLVKLRTALDDERKRIKKQCMTPYLDFEKQVKEIIDLIDEPINLIDSQIKEVDEKRKTEKKEKIFDIYKENIGNLKDILPFNKVLKKEYLNVNKSIKSITEEMIALINEIKTGINTIEELNTKYELQVKDMYIRTFDLSMALHENARLIEVEKKLKEQREKEQREKEQREREQAEKENRPKQTDVLKEPERVAPAIPTPAIPAPENPEKKYVVGLRVLGTRAELDAFAAFLVNNNIRYNITSKPQEV